MIVVTGAAGFIGSCLLWKLNKEALTDIIVVDEKITPAKRRNIEGKKFRDFLDKDNFLSLVLSDKLPDTVEAIFHLGACSSTTFNDAEYFRKNNTDYSRKLAEYALRKNIRFIYASSGATYGDGSLGFSDSDETTLKLKPLNLYGNSKQTFDLWVIKNGYADKLVGLKYFNVFGPNEYHKADMRSLIAKAYEQVLTEKKIKLFKSHGKEYGDGESKRDFLYVKDAVEATYFFFEKRDKSGIYNVGSGRARSWNDLARAIFDSLGMAPEIEYMDMPENLRGKYQYFTEADISKLIRAGYEKNFYTLEDGVREYVAFLKEKRYL